MNKLSNSDLEIKRLAFFKSISKLSLLDLNNQSQGWSILQHLYHCWLVEHLTEKYIRNKILNPTLITRVPITSYIRFFLLQVFLRLGYKTNAPKPTSIFPDTLDLNKLNLDWSNSRESLDNLIYKLHELKLENKGFFRHPIIGRINLRLTLNFFNFHFYHHQRQIIKIITKL